ncbi:MAG: PepSY-like domain-containing protein [Ginsengibacter sp.]
MKKIVAVTAILFAMSNGTFAQENEANEHINVPNAVKTALHQKYPQATHVGWEKENGNYEANWGGKDHEANSVQFTPAGKFIEIVKEIPVSQLPSNVVSYVKSHYHTKVTEAGKVTDAKGKTSYEAEVHGKDVIFDANGNFVRSE